MVSGTPVRSNTLPSECFTRARALIARRLRALPEEMQQSIEAEPQMIPVQFDIGALNAPPARTTPKDDTPMSPKYWIHFRDPTRDARSSSLPRCGPIPRCKSDDPAPTFRAVDLERHSLGCFHTESPKMASGQKLRGRRRSPGSEFGFKSECDENLRAPQK